MNGVISNVTVGATALRKGQICKIVGGLAVPCTVLGEAFFGVAESDYVAGQLGSFCVFGETEVETAAVLTVGSVIRTDVDGRAVATAASSQAVGLLLEPGLAVITGSAAYAKVIVRGHNVVS